MSIRRFTSAAAIAAVAATAFAVAPANADPLKVTFPVSGTATVKKQNATLTLPAGAKLAGDFDLASQALSNGSLTIPAFSANIRLYGIPVLGDTTSTVRIVQTKPTTAIVQADHKVKAVATLRLELPKVSSNLLPNLNIVDSTCRTGDFTATLLSSNDFSLTDALNMSATYTIPKFQQCGFLRNELLNTLLAGDGNKMTLKVGPIDLTGGTVTAS